jgi:hypothetical protein
MDGYDLSKSSGPARPEQRTSRRTASDSGEVLARSMLLLFANRRLHDLDDGRYPF